MLSRLFVALVTVLMAGLLGPARTARADTRESMAVADDQHGLVVLGMGSAVDVAWPLARAIYAEAALRPLTLDEAHARVLVGEPPGEAAAAELRDLADTRAAIHGDDAASRRLLQSIALALHVKGVVVVEPAPSPTARPSARVFVTTSTNYDPVRYDPDPAASVTWGSGASAPVWSGAVQALRRGFGEALAPPAPPAPAPAAPAPVVEKPSPVVQGISLFVPSNMSNGVAADHKAGKAFYQSPWFWAAAGAAVFGGLAVYLATRNDSPSNIQLQVQVPR